MSSGLIEAQHRREERQRARTEKSRKLTRAEEALEEELERQKITGRDLGRLIEAVLLEICPSAIPGRD